MAEVVKHNTDCKGVFDWTVAQTLLRSGYELCDIKRNRHAPNDTGSDYLVFYFRMTDGFMEAYTAELERKKQMRKEKIKKAMEEKNIEVAE